MYSMSFEIQRLHHHPNMEVPLPYMERRLLTYLVSPCPELTSKKKTTPGIFFGTPLPQGTEIFSQKTLTAGTSLF